MGKDNLKNGVTPDIYIYSNIHMIIYMYNYIHIYVCFDISGQIKWTINDETW